MGLVQSITSRLGGTKLPKESAVLSKVDGLYKQREKTSLDQFHRQWFVDIAMRAGLQYIQVDMSRGEIRLPPDEEDRVRMVINKMQPIHTTKVGKLALDSPVWSVSPFAKDEEAKDAAKMDEALLRNLFNNEDMEVEKLAFLGWAIDTGNVFWKIVWDHEAGDDIEDMDGNSAHEGDVRLILVPPFDIVCDQQAKQNALRGEWVMHVHEETLSTITTEWPERGGLVKAEKDLSQRSYYQRRILSLVGNQSEYFGTDSESKNTAIVKELFIRPNAKNPRGQYMAVANGIWLNPDEEGESVAPLPYKHLYTNKKFYKEPFPFVHMLDNSLSGSPWGRGSMQDLVPPQKGYNRVWSQVIENGNNFGNLKVLAPKNCELSTEAFDDSGNEVIEYENGFGEPHLMQPASLPQHVMGQFSLYDAAFMETSGMREVSKGYTPPGVKSGVAISGLQQQDDVRLNPTMIHFKSALRNAGEHALALYREFLLEDEVRTIHVLGEQGYEAAEIVREKMVPEYAVRVQLDTQAAWQKEVKRQQVENAYEKGLFGDQNDPQVRKMVVSALEYGDLQKFFAEAEMDEKNAKDNIERIQMGHLEQVGMDETEQFDEYGIPVQLPKLGIKANPWEDHQTHIRVYNNFRKSMKWKQWPPEKQKILNDLAEEHAKMSIPPPPPPQPPKVNLSIAAKAMPQEIEEIAGLKITNPAPIGMDSDQGDIGGEIPPGEIPPLPPQVGTPIENGLAQQ